MKSNYWNKIKKKKTNWGPAPTEASENIKAPELAPRDKRFTGRTKKLGLMTTPEFHQQLKKIAAGENCLMIEVVEKAVAEYSKKIKQHNLLPN